LPTCGLFTFSNKVKNASGYVDQLTNLYIKVVPPARFERAAPGLGILRSIQLSYGGDEVSRRTFYTNSYFLASTSQANSTKKRLPFQAAFLI
jgi:hypothetical protein